MATVVLSCENLPATDPDALSVRHFSVHEAMSTPFRAAILARSRSSGIALSTLVGRRAQLRILPELDQPLGFQPRAWSGVVGFMEQTQAEPTGESTYFLELVPDLWRLGHKRACRVFQRKSIPEIVRAILARSNVAATWIINESAHPKLEYRVQYNETDLDFAQRMLEEAGIAYYFTDENAESRLVLSDAPHLRDPREEGAVRYVDNPTRSGGREHLTHVHLSQAVAPTLYQVRDYDFRNPGYRVTGVAPRGQAPAGDLAQYRYAPGYSRVETPGRPSNTPVADDDGVYRSDEPFASSRAEHALQGIRAARRQVRYQTNAIGLAPGVVFTIADHPHPELAASQRLLVVESTVEGAPAAQWSFAGRALFAGDGEPYRPLLATARPHILGPQTAIVVGPDREEIHVDEFGRVRVQFHWDREGAPGVLDEHSSCWVRVSQGWAGAGFGMMMIPRVGQEVLVGFLDGDPDQPVVVGRLYNETQRVPYTLPQHKTVSTWKSRSSPDSDGFNEIKFDDEKGDELVYIQAQKNLRKLVKNNESIRVGVNRSASIGAVNSIVVGTKHDVTVAQPRDPPPTIPPTEFTMIDKKITLTTGEATIELDGPNIRIEAKGFITLTARENVIALNTLQDDITMTSHANITGDAANGDIALMAKQNFLVGTGGGVTVDAQGAGSLPGSVAPPARGAVSVTASDTFKAISVKELVLGTTDVMKLASVKDMGISSVANLKILATRDVIVQSGDDLKLIAPKVAVDATGKITVISSGGDVQILGGPTVKINTR